MWWIVANSYFVTDAIHPFPSSRFHMPDLEKVAAAAAVDGAMPRGV